MTDQQRASGGPVTAGRPMVERDQDEVVVPAAPYSWQNQLHTAAIDNLADAIREHTAVIRARLEPPTQRPAPDTSWVTTEPAEPFGSPWHFLAIIGGILVAGLAVTALFAWLVP